MYILTQTSAAVLPDQAYKHAASMMKRQMNSQWGANGEPVGSPYTQCAQLMQWEAMLPSWAKGTHLIEEMDIGLPLEAPQGQVLLQGA